ncbi:MAG: hypothetical protein V1744_04705 [Candidatus Altiarchaeota archaeon]
MENRGQLSTEYLVILAVVVIVALIVVTVLGGFIDIGGGASSQASKAYWRGSDIGMLNWNMKPSGASSDFVLRNNLDYTIKVTQMTVGDQTVIGDGGANVTITPGKTSVVSKDINACVSGPYSLAVSFTYDDVQHGINGIEFDGVKNLEGTC